MTDILIPANIIAELSHEVQNGIPPIEHGSNEITRNYNDIVLVYTVQQVQNGSTINLNFNETINRTIEFRERNKPYTDANG